jgi:hypothetical protein
MKLSRIFARGIFVHDGKGLGLLREIISKDKRSSFCNISCVSSVGKITYISDRE